MHLHRKMSVERSRLRFFVLFAFALLVSQASVLAEPGVSDKEIIIGSSCDQSSPAGQRGRTLLQGARAYFDYVNAHGGIFGRQIKLLSYDDNYDAEKTITHFNELVKQGIFAGAFFVGSPNAAKLVPMAQLKKIPILGIVSGAEFIYKPVKRYIFNYRASFEDETKALIDGVWNGLGYKRIAIIYQEDAFGSSGLAGATLALSKYNVTPVAVASFPKGSIDVDKAIEAARAAHPQAVFVSAVGTPVKEIVKRAHAQGWNPLFMTITIDPVVYEAEGTVIAQLLPPLDRSDLPTIQLYDKLLAKVQGAQPSYGGLEGFVQAMLVAEALKRAGKEPTREKFVEALESMHDFDIGLGPSVKVNFSPLDHGGVRSVYFTVVSHGAAVPFSNWKKLEH